jgi:hypothetical protein
MKQLEKKDVVVRDESREDTESEEEESDEETTEEESQAEAEARKRKEDADARAHDEFMGIVHNRVKEKLHEHPNKEVIQEHVLRMLNEGCRNAHNRFSGRPNELRVTRHGIGLRANDNRQEMLMFDPGGENSRLLSDLCLQKTTEALMLGLIDYWKAIRVEFTFAPEWQNMCRTGPENYARSHAAWKDRVNEDTTAGDSGSLKKRAKQG